VTGYSVTLEVFVPYDVAERTVRRLDEAWQVENWTPEAAAFEVAKEALRSAGLHGAVSLDVQEVTS
jgi:chaperone required for assembly of F1-ATPase